ncbi:MAG: hypothetical protein KatS3mg052_2493 [Candidatus Roseilinea sp.]|nr:MAG: hypothetical protein KatS3mg052_2493 [Candidatus Roseilinea sp.]
MVVALIFVPACATTNASAPPGHPSPPTAAGAPATPQPAAQLTATPTPVWPLAALLAIPTETPAPPQQKIVIESPARGATVLSPFRLSGNVALTPMDKTLRYRLTDAFGNVIGNGKIAVEGVPGEPGVFSATVAYAMSPAGPLRIEVIGADGAAEQTAQIPMLTVNLPQGVRLTINAIATKLRADAVPRKPNIRFPIDWNGWPRHLRLLFDEDQPGAGFDPRQRQILILPLEDYQKLFRGAEAESFGQAIRSFQALLAERPAQLKQDPLLLPASDLSQAMRAQVRYLEFDGGSGMRFLTHLTQELRPLTASSLIYTFQGLTYDGRYYIAAYFPVTTTVLPATSAEITQSERDEFKRDYFAYAEGIAQKLDAQPASFTPALAALDAMIASLQIDGDVLSQGLQSADAPIGQATELLNIRSGPGTRFRIIGQLDPGEQVELLTRNTEASWLRIRSASGVVGWVSRDYVDTAFDIRQLPIQP